MGATSHIARVRTADVSHPRKRPFGEKRQNRAGSSSKRKISHWVGPGCYIMVS